MTCDIKGEVVPCNTFFIILGVFFVILGLIMIFKFDWSKKIYEFQMKLIGVNINKNKPYIFNRILSFFVGVMCLIVGLFFVLMFFVW